MPSCKMRDVKVGEAIRFNNEIWVVFTRHEQTRGNLRMNLLKHDEKILQVELPQSVEVEVVDAPDSARGDTATAVFKLAKVETGGEVKVPGHIHKGDRIKLRTEDGEFLGRV